MAFQNPTAAYTAADVAPTIPERWAPFIHDIKVASMSVMNHATDLSDLVSEGGDVVNIPNIYTNVFSVSTQGTEGNGVVDQSPAQGNNTLPVDTHKYIAFVLGDKTMKQIATNYKISQKYSEQAVKLLMKDIEKDMYALVTSLTRTDIGVGTAAMSDLVIRQAIAELTEDENASYEVEDLAFFIHSTIWFAQILGIAKYYQKLQSGFDAVKNGTVTNFGVDMSKRSLVGVLYNVPVYISNLVPEASTVVSNMLLHKEAFAFAFHTQGANGIRVQADYLLQNLATLVVVDAIYGVGCIRPDAGITILADIQETVA